MELIISLILRNVHSFHEMPKISVKTNIKSKQVEVNILIQLHCKTMKIFLHIQMKNLRKFKNMIILIFFFKKIKQTYGKL